MNIHKYIFASFLICIAIFCHTSCSNEFELTEGAQNIPIVYGVLSQTDTATYIRVERAFINETTSAYELSKDPNLLYYPNATVKLRHVATGKEYTLKKVDGNLEGYKRDQGAFADAPNFLYKIKKSELAFIGKDEYKLIVTGDDSQVYTEANCIMISPYSDLKGDVSPQASAKFSFAYLSDFSLRWFGDPAVVINDVYLDVHYTEEKGGTTTDKKVTWQMAKNYTKINNNTLGTFEYKIKGKLFYEFMVGAVGKDPLAKRYFKNLSLTIVSGGQAIKDYISIGQANLGITSSGEIPVYTNLSNGAQGIFSSKTVFVRNDIELALPSLDSLRNGIITKDLNFK